MPNPPEDIYQEVCLTGNRHRAGWQPIGKVLHGSRRMGRKNKRMLGSEYEQRAAEYLTRQGLEIAERNYRSRQGEIDLIARDGSYLVFVEVKYRSDDRKGDPAEAVGYYKQQHIRAAARYYMYQNWYGDDTPCRFDVVAILEDDIRWIRDAF